jgi:hypothetical protein
MAEPGGVRRFGPPGRELAAFLELTGITGLAFAQPTFDLLGKNAGLFVAWNTTPMRAVFLVLVVILFPPAVAYALEVVLGAVAPGARPLAHAVLLGLGVGLIVAEAVKHLFDPAPAFTIGLAVGASAVAALVFARVPLARVWSRVLAIAPGLLALVLLFGSPASAVIFDSDPAPADARVAAPARVVMIVMDEFPLVSLLDGGGRIDAELFPNLAALAERGTWYRNSTTVAQHTEAAIPAILTGRLPRHGHEVPVTAEHPDNLFTLLGGTYAMNVHESVTRLCPVGLCPARSRATGVHPGWRGMLRDTARIWGEFADPAREDTPVFGGLGAEDAQALATADRFLASLQPTGARPRLDFLHVLLPHFPWHYLPTGQDFAALPGHTTGLVGQDWANDDVAALMRVRHLLQVQATDTFVGKVVARLRELGEYDRSLIVVTADHGVAFRGGAPIRGITRSTVPDIAWTPLIVKAPGQVAGGVDDRPAESVDVLPTMADVLAVDLPGPVDGRSLRGAPRRASTFPMFDWSRGVWHPPAGDDFLQLDRVGGFERVLARRAAPPAEFADERVFQVGPYGASLGEVAAPFVDPTPTGIRTTLDGPLRYLLVDQGAAKTPFVAIHGTTTAPRAGESYAVVVNGWIAGLSTSYRVPGSDTVEFWGTLVPRFFRNGRNLVQVYRVDGTPDAPRLRLLDSAAAG